MVKSSVHAYDGDNLVEEINARGGGWRIDPTSAEIETLK
jgi:hypothetical protein